ncbi:hypothetical protein HN295_19460, partial [Acinetobacter baumannii]|uniref:DUF6708 domain-containing protein n=1 Tax=Acinetobacter baumannii TaxID=470 RepID=UPI001897786B
VVFDRQHRKVYRLLPNEGTGIMGVLRHRPLVACEYDWDLIDVESRIRFSITRGQTSDCSLTFRVRRSREDGTMIDWFDIDVRELAQGNVDPMWEHIRRFMEEGGPHRPDPAEPLLRSRVPLSFWESLGMTGQWKPVFLLYWGTSPLRSVLSLPLFLMGLPFRLLAGMEVCLKEKTRLPVRWPSAV